MARIDVDTSPIAISPHTPSQAAVSATSFAPEQQIPTASAFVLRHEPVAVTSSVFLPQPGQPASGAPVGPSLQLASTFPMPALQHVAMNNVGPSMHTAAGFAALTQPAPVSAAALGYNPSARSSARRGRHDAPGFGQRWLAIGPVAGWSTIRDERVALWSSSIGNAPILMLARRNGFRPGYRTNNNVLLLRCLAERARAQDKTRYVVLADIFNAFPSTNRDLLWVKLQRMGISGQSIDWLCFIYECMRYQVRVEGELSEPFESTIGVLIGDSASPTLWNLFMADFEIPAYMDDLCLAGVLINFALQAMTRSYGAPRSLGSRTTLARSCSIVLAWIICGTVSKPYAWWSANCPHPSHVYTSLVGHSSSSIIRSSSV